MTRRTTDVRWAPPTKNRHRFDMVGNAHPTRPGITLVEMLIAMTITLVMMAAVVTLFANVSDSVRNRRATIELGGQLRHVRNVLQADLANATCPGLTWRRPESNQGYIEIVEGQYRDYNPSVLTDGVTDGASNPEINPKLDPSIIPRNDAVPDYNLDGRIDDLDRDEHSKRWSSLKVRENQLAQVEPQKLTDESTNPLITIANGLGDYDDILMLTVRNEHEPFVGRVPQWNTGATWRVDGHNTGWSSETKTSPLAEVVWFAVENPARDANGDGINDTGNFFGEPGMRTIYRRALLVAPWLDPYATTPVGSRPGVVRDYPDLPEDDGTGSVFSVAQALAELIAFQDQYDLSVRMERYVVANGKVRTRFVANTLGDLTKRENRYEHFFFNPNLSPPDRQYPFAVVSAGTGYSNGALVQLVPAIYGGFSAPGAAARATANVDNGSVVSYTVNSNDINDVTRRYQSRPLAYVDDNGTTLATARAMLNDEGQVVRVIRGLVPLWGARRGEDVMLTDALAFDLRVYDPGAPLFGLKDNGQVSTVLEPGDPAWIGPPNAIDNYAGAYRDDDNMRTDGLGAIGTNTSNTSRFPYFGQGAYVDLGYGFDTRPQSLQPLPDPKFAAGLSHVDPWYFEFRSLRDVYDNLSAPDYAVYDTWSFHYENDGIDEDNRDGDDNPVTGADEATNGLDDPGHYVDPTTGNIVTDTRNGADDVGERETAPPYDRPLRGVQVTLRAYERDSRQIRQSTVRQQLMPQ